MSRLKLKTHTKWHRMRHVARMLQTDLVNVYNWKNYKSNPLPVEQHPEGLVVNETQLKDWLSMFHPELLLVWEANAKLSDAELASKKVLNKQEVFLQAVKQAVKL